VLAFALLSSEAGGDEVDKKAQARALFDAAMSNIQQGRYFDAVCAQLAESQRLDPALGTQYHWARCLENTGRLASAWAVYLEVAELAGSQGLPEQQRYARERADALKPKLTKLIITVPLDLQQMAGTEVRRDGVLLSPTQYGLALPVDGGRHEISVVATGRRKWTTTVEAPAGTEGATITVSVPTLTEDPPLGPVGSGAPSAGATSTPGGADRATVGLVIGGAGLVGLGVGAALSIVAKSTYDGASSHCNAANQCDMDGLSSRRQALTFADASTVTLIVGGVALAAGAVLWLTAPGTAPQGKPSARFILGPSSLSFVRSF
jgi:hypothetical protein